MEFSTTKFPSRTFVPPAFPAFCFVESRSPLQVNGNSDCQKLLYASPKGMDLCGKHEFSSEAERRLHQISSKLNSENPFNAFKNKLSLLDHGPSFDSDKTKANVEDEKLKVKDISNSIKDCLSCDVIISETLLADVSFNSLESILIAIKTCLDEFKFCTFCKSVATWKEDGLVEHCLRLVALPKLKEITEAPGCVIFSLKELTHCKPAKICENILIPLLSDEEIQFTDTELLSEMFSVLPPPQKDLLILTFRRKNKFSENDWLLLHSVIKDLTSNNVANVLECIQKFSNKFTKSLLFGRFLVNFCHSLDFINKRDKEFLKEAIETHETLLKAQALKYLESV